jgi:hypothetical protein
MVRQAAEEHGRHLVDWISGGYRRVVPGQLPRFAAM